MTTTETTLAKFHQAQAAFRAPDAVAHLAKVVGISEVEAAKVVQRVLATSDADFLSFEARAPKADGRRRLSIGDATDMRAGSFRPAVRSTVFSGTTSSASALGSLEAACSSLGGSFGVGGGIGNYIFYCMK